jgi:hypothetical protein
MRAGIYSRFGPSATLGEQFIEHVNALQWAIHMLPADSSIATTMPDQRWASGKRGFTEGRSAGSTV